LLEANKIKEFKEYPETLGEHLKKRRCELALLQREVAKELRIPVASYFNWENGYAEPMIRFLPKLIGWLGYDPFPEPTTAGEEIMAKRRRRGISRKALATEMGIDESTLEKIEESATLLKHGMVRTMKQVYVRLRTTSVEA
jgi:transcriptional regulator with XRE-family HTH domain